MSRSRMSLAALAFGASLILSGCGGSTTTVDSGPAPAPGSVKADPIANIPADKAKAGEAEAPKADAPKADAPKTDAPKIEAPKAGSAALTSDEKAEIAKLESKADQDQATAQLTCLVSGENLGSMGVPVKVSHDGKSAFLCCKGCVKDFEKDPKAALAKLAK